VETPQNTYWKFFFKNLFIWIVLLGLTEFLVHIIVTAIQILGAFSKSQPDFRINIPFMPEAVFTDDFRLYAYIIPAVLFMFLMIIDAFISKGIVSGIVSSLKPVKTGKPDKRAPERDLDEEKRRFLHFLSVLQREGRLLDFFNEDLSLYEDEQIGAAVRGIHESCKKTMKKYIDPVPVTDIEEGAEIVIDEGFDPETFKLVGNVTGNPPFKGIVRHRGWKASRQNMPELSKIKDSSIMAPAEVEIV
jgi:hypothetical protein